MALAARLIEAGAALEPEETRARWTPLHEAARSGHRRMLAGLIRQGADPRRADAEGRNALTLARMGLHDEAAALLAEAGVEEQPEHAVAVAEARREAAEERARRAAEEARNAEFQGGRPGRVTTGAFSGMRGEAREIGDDRVQVRLQIFGRTTLVELAAGEFELDGAG